jgi:parvulin-like peptidyl-prolyl isomerase
MVCVARRFALQVGDLSGIVDTDSGVHIILRTA